MYVIMIIAHAKLTGKFPFFVDCVNKRITLVIWPAAGSILAFWESHSDPLLE